jgi:hypothetical protein
LGRQEEGRREAQRKALRRAPNFRVIGSLLRSLGNLGRADADAVEAATAAVHLERVQGVFSSAATTLLKGVAKTEKGVRKGMKG